MKPSAIVINVSRGAVIDEVALYQALTEKTIAAAGIDVFETEPITPDNPLTTLPNVVLAPTSVPAVGKRGQLWSAWPPKTWWLPLKEKQCLTVSPRT